MARATKGTRVLKRVTKKTVPTVVLELSEGEADYLQAVLCKVRGNEEKSPQKYGKAIVKALAHATEQDFDDTDAYKLLDKSGGLDFRNYPEPRLTVDPGGINITAATNYLKHYADGMYPGEADYSPEHVGFPRTGWGGMRGQSPTYVAYDELGPASGGPLDDDGHRRP